jgi:ribonuclease Y
MIACFVVALALGVFVGVLFYKKSTDKKLGDVAARTKKMVDDANTECKALKKEAILEAKEQELKLRNDFERETKEKKAELNKQEQRLLQKEDNLDKKEDSLN